MRRRPALEHVARHYLPVYGANGATEIRDHVLERALWAEDGRVRVDVRRGTINLSGSLDYRSDVELLARLTRRVQGVVAVASSVAWRVDDTTLRGRTALARSA